MYKTGYQQDRLKKALQHEILIVSGIAYNCNKKPYF